MTEFIHDNCIENITLFKNGIPENTNIHCWWCCHKFEGKPLCMPVKYDSIKKLFICKGVFCSFGCTKAYILNMNTVNNLRISQNLTLMSLHMGNNLRQPITCAPPREVLSIFGGYMDIKEFREKSNKNITVKTMDTTRQVMNISVSESGKVCKNKNTSKSMLLESMEQPEKPKLKLKREKPLPIKKGTLEYTMGLSINNV